MGKLSVFSNKYLTVAYWNSLHSQSDRKILKINKTISILRDKYLANSSQFIWNLGDEKQNATYKFAMTHIRNVVVVVFFALSILMFTSPQNCNLVVIHTKYLSVMQENKDKGVVLWWLRTNKFFGESTQIRNSCHCWGEHAFVCVFVCAFSLSCSNFNAR